METEASEPTLYKLEDNTMVNGWWKTINQSGEQFCLLRANGRLEYWKSGKYHNDNGKPAIVHPDGREEYWVNGKRHRDGDEPALVRPNGIIEYWVNGHLHRDNDKPAIIFPDGSEQYWVSGNLHRDHNRPARIAMTEMCQVPKYIQQLNGTQFSSVYNRQFGEHPFNEFYKEKYPMKECYVNNKLHGDSDHPARVGDDISEWYQNGKRFRKNGLPSTIMKNGNMYWTTENGLLGRPHDLPAVVYNTGKQCWYHNNRLHRGEGLPAVVDPTTGDKHYYFNGRLHRLGDLPAIERKNEKVFCEYGVMTRANDLPAVMRDTNDSGDLGTREWYVGGLRQRIDTNKPSVVSRGVASHKFEWFVADKLHRENDLPAFVSSKVIPGGIILREYSWYKHGKLHRANGQPAVIKTGGTREWWVDGVRQFKGSQPVGVTEARVIFGVVVASPIELQTLISKNLVQEHLLMFQEADGSRRYAIKDVVQMGPGEQFIEYTYKCFL